MKRTKDILIAASALKAGKLVAFATETVYGLGADAMNDKAVAAIFAAKGRPHFNPLISHVADIGGAMAIGEFSNMALKLAKAFWPGPLTMVVPKKADCKISLLASAGLETIAIRIPAHKMAHAMLEQFAGPVVAPSANSSGFISPTSPEHVKADLGEKIDVLLDGGECSLGLESTIISCVDDQPVLLRHGGITRQQIETLLDIHLPTQTTAGDKPSAPGQLTSHYAPRLPLRMNATKAGKGEVLLGFGDMPDPNLSPSGDLTEAAANLFKMLHQLDKTTATAIAVAPIPTTGLGEAINDRLHRAAANRD